MIIINKDMSIAQQRLAEERKELRKDIPRGFYARPTMNADGSANLMLWQAGIRGKDGTDWEGGLFQCSLIFSEEYPSKAPLVKFVPCLFHVNIFSTGNVCLDILNANWSSSIKIKDLLISLQTLLSEPNSLHSTDRPEISTLHRKNPLEYAKRVKEQTKKFIPKDE